MDLLHETNMREALRLAQIAAQWGEVPVGAIVVREGLCLGQGHNRNMESSDPTAHAEIVALREACLYSANYRLPDTVIYVSLEPCLMCFAAILQARVKTLIYGAPDPKGGYSNFLSQTELAGMNHHPEIIGGVLAEDSAAMIRAFFKEQRARGKRKWLKQS